MTELSSSQTETLLPFMGDSMLGYLDTAMGRLYAVPYQGGAAIDDHGWITYDNLATKLQLYGTDGQGRTLYAYAYPWFKASWRILLRADQMGIARIDQQGSILWEREFSMPITALDNSSLALVVGLLDGTLYILDAQGKTVFLDQESFQKIRTVYGVAVSNDGKYVAVLRGFSPQKIETYRQSGSSYAKISESSLREPTVLQASMAFAEDDSHVILARENQLLYYNVRDNYIRQIRLNLFKNERLDTSEDVQRYVLKSTGGATVPVLETRAADPSETRILILKHGLVEFVVQGAVSLSAGEGKLALVYEDGVQLVQGWQP